MQTTQVGSNFLQNYPEENTKNTQKQILHST